MRWLHLFVLPICLLGRPATLQSQEKKPPDTLTVEVLGHKLEYWIKEISSKDQSKSETAIQTVMLFGPDRAYAAVPTLLERLRNHPRVPVDLSVRVNGIMVLGYIMGNYKAANQKDITDTVGILTRFLGDDQNIVRLRALQALGGMGTAARVAIPGVCNAVKDPKTFETRKAAVIALGQIAIDKNGPTFDVLSALCYALSGNEHSMHVRLASIQSLTTLGGPADPKLRTMLFKSLEPVAVKDPEPSVRIWAHMAVMSITKTVVKDRVDAIAQMVSNPEATVRVQAIVALGSIGPDAKQAIPLLTKALSDQEPLVVAWSLWALGRIGAAAGGALPALERIKNDPMQLEYLRNMAEDAINLINGKKK
jgi:hypothetical protein